MKKLLSGLVLLYLFLCSMPSLSEENSKQLSLNIDNKIAVFGQLHIELYHSASPFPVDSKDWKALPPYEKKQVVIEGANLTMQFKDLAAGWYAVRLYVDENANQQLDVSRAGIPKEAVGFSNNPMLFKGRPKIASTSFELAQNTQLDVRLVKDKRKKR